MSDCFLIGPAHLLSLTSGGSASHVQFSSSSQNKDDNTSLITATRVYIGEESDFFVAKIEQSENSFLNVKKINDCVPIEKIQNFPTSAVFSNHNNSNRKIGIFKNRNFFIANLVGYNKISGKIDFSIVNSETALFPGDSGKIIYYHDEISNQYIPLSIYIGATVCEDLKYSSSCFYSSISIADTLRKMRMKNSGPQQSRSKKFLRRAFRIKPEGIELTKSLQIELGRLGCDPGPADGIWGKKSFEAYERFSESVTANEIANLELDLEMLRNMQALQESVCSRVCSDDETRRDGECVKISCPPGTVLFSDGRCEVPKYEKTASETKPNRTSISNKTNPTSIPKECIEFNGQTYCF